MGRGGLYRVLRVVWVCVVGPVGVQMAIKGWGAAAARQREASEAKAAGTYIEPEPEQIPTIKLPLNEQPGRCGHCAGNDLDLSTKGGVMIRRCTQCHQKIDVMTMGIVRHGLPGLKWEG